MGDDCKYNQLEAEFEAYFANDPVGGIEDSDERDNSSEPSEIETAEAFARYLSYNNIMSPEHPMAPFLIEGVKEKIVKIYNEEKIKIKGILKNLDGHISVSAEMLRSTDLDEYVCLQAHFIDENWKLKEWVLRYRSLPDDIVIVTGIQKGLSFWGIEDKVSTITLKSPNYIKYIGEMADEVKEQVQKKKTLQLGGKLFHVYCCAELLNQMVQVGFKEVSDTIDKAKLLIAWGRSEPMWHLTTSRLKMAIQMQSEGEFESAEPGGFYELPSAEEWKNAEGVCKVVDVIDTVAKFLFLRENPTACDFLGNLVKLKVRLASEAVKSDDFLKGVVEKMVKKLDEYLKSMFLVLAIATVMDPRCKMHYIKFMCSKIEAGNGDSQVSTVLEAVRSLYNDNYSVSALNRNMASSSSKGENTSVKQPEEGGNVKSQKTDLDQYLEDPVLSWSQDFDLLTWWKESSSKYPTLARMARDLLPIPWLGITSYDAYYTEERMVDMAMVSQGQNFTNALMCTRSWFSKRSGLTL